ncbi:MULTISPECIES: anti-sigma factor family protein [Micromonospora]|uniref:Putative zinc-finger n=1 Tax=Micromonospora yangpuensis TaxID=683228 RepID=A0A1C6U056_9ACTN|nr:zf-HC2 domain-containing protein [Micromonospora yangpuensis]GGM21483.1 anti-sigma factor [Micromonospora yangpuensis]SCL47269.1 Putative zinc-finger [Micromonospora yangpuensis]
MTGCEFAFDDGAYVLGALPPGERATYERHLSTCPACRESVAEIAVLPGLLSRLDPNALDQFLPPPTEPSRVPSLLDTASRRRRGERRRNRWRYAGVGLAAAALALVVGVGAANVLSEPAGPPEVRMVAMQPVAGTVPVSAEVGLTAKGWGTEVAMRCGYDQNAGHGKAFTFRLVAYGPDGAKEQIGSWLAAPGDDLRLTGATRFTGAELVRLELLRADGTPVLGYDIR